MKTPLNNVWLIDDNEIDNFINKKTILKNNFSLNVKDFNSAVAAEKYIKELQVNESNKAVIPDLIFLDLNMPICSGTEFLKNCESILLQLNPDLKIIILTSSINPNDEFNTSLFSSFKAYINKPLNASNLSEL
jgi:CheY-like chemotaxis protein